MRSLLGRLASLSVLLLAVAGEPEKAQLPAHAPVAVRELEVPPTVNAPDGNLPGLLIQPTVPPSEQFPPSFPNLDFPSDPPRRIARRPSPERNWLNPPGRWMHGMAQVQGKLYLWGGVSNSASLLNDLWVYNYDQNEWTELEAPSLPDLPLNTNPKDISRSAQARPPNVPRPPRMKLPPGVPNAPPPIQDEGKPDGMREWWRNQKSPSVTLATPVESMEPVSPYIQPAPTVTPPALLQTGETARAAKASRRLRGSSGRAQPPAGGSRQSLPYLSPPLRIPVPVAPGVPCLRPGEAVSSLLQLQSLAARRLDALSTSSATSTSTLTPKPEEPSPLVMNDMWVYDLKSRRWSMPAQTTAAPSPRWLHSMLNYKDDVIIIGGVSNDYILHNDGWKYVPSSNTWTQLTVSGDAAKAPAPREGQAIAVAAGSTPTLYMFGGVSYNYMPFADLWKVAVSGSSITYTKQTDQGLTPPPRWLHTATFIKTTKETSGVVAVFGGCSAQFAPLDDLWFYRMQAKQWEQRFAKGWPPSARFLHIAFDIQLASERGIVIHGGAANNAPYDDMYYLDLQNADAPAWEQSFPAGNHPFAREGHAVAVIAPDPAAPAESPATTPAPAKPKAGAAGEGASEVAPKENPFEPPKDVVHMSDRFPQRLRRKDFNLMNWVFVFGGAAERGLVGSLQGGDGYIGN
eukprot:PLAT6198.1.p2 GENE.PLAT6198.1~~PLAT6198.1.p2  ORF type:complete len:685 (+),score=309.03 PLAT6198.1:30-2084(+)